MNHGCTSSVGCLPFRSINFPTVFGDSPLYLRYTTARTSGLLRHRFDRFDAIGNGLCALYARLDRISYSWNHRRNDAGNHHIANI